jgi:formylglycine-generating enzyme
MDTDGEAVSGLGERSRGGNFRGWCEVRYGARMGYPRARRGVWVLAAVLSLGACKQMFPSRPPPKVDRSLACGAVRPSPLPFLEAWGQESRDLITKGRAAGAIVVSYRAVGCNVELEVLPQCVAPGGYRYAAHTARDTKRAATPNQLFSEFTVGGASLAGHLRGDVALRSDSVTVGVASLPVRDVFRTSELTGADCQRATHVISQIYLGGFTLVEGHAADLDEVANPFSPKGRSGLPKGVKPMVQAGAPAACTSAANDGKETAACAVPLRVGLLAIEGRASSGCPDGTTLEGETCIPRAALTEAGCPPGTKLVGGQCTGELASGCPSGTRFVGGYCVTPTADAGAVVEATEDAGPPPPPGMVLIPRGTLTMGSNDGEPNEKPVHPVQMKAFWMDATEVTVEAFAECVRAGACSGFPIDPLCNSGRQAGRLNHPVNCVTATEAEEYCRWAHKRLPTEVEWEYGARGGDARVYPWGDSSPAGQACWNGEGNNVGRGARKSTCPVGSFPAGKSPFGLLDMAGNVMEWTSSGFSDDYERDRSEGTRVVRGGSWEHGNPNSVRAALRVRSGVESRVRHLVGFRCAQSIP